MKGNIFERKFSVEEQTFKKYVEDLELKPGDFNKVILDVGAGNAYFAKWAKEHKVSSKIYSLEPSEEILEKEKGLVAKAEEIPMPNEFFDLIISNGAIPNIYLDTDNVKEKVEKSFSEMFRVLKDGGEIRLARVLIGHKYESQMVLADSVREVLQKLKEKYNLETKKIHMPSDDSYEWEGHKKKDLLAESFLIILKKPKKEAI